ncbi:MAG TPA: class I SAM-dependent methyltransferase [Vicinamibacterales bacterium]|nr:class I SAM-dependent methyltransferase [Vicinamibacterales bacterium]
MPDESAFYRSFAAKRLTTPGARRRTRIEAHRLAALHRHRTPPGDFLEIGPGHGTLARAAVAAGWRYCGIEPSPVLAPGLARQGLSIIRAWTPPFPVRDACCDVLWADQVLEHMNGAPEARAFVAEIRRVLRPEGVAIIVVPDYAKERWFFWDIDYTHNFVTTERRMRQLLEDGGVAVAGVTRAIGAATGTLRMLLAAAALPANLPGLDALMRAVGQDELLFRVRKNLFQTLLFVGRRS